MTEPFPAPSGPSVGAGPSEDLSPAAGTSDPTPPATGDRLVDEVLASLDGLADRPLAEHVAVLETAHERLRNALTHPAGRTGTLSPEGGGPARAEPARVP